MVATNCLLPISILFSNFRHVEGEYMFGIELILKSDSYLPFQLHQWYVDVDSVMWCAKNVAKLYMFSIQPSKYAVTV
jgi:hypothetical protein